MHSTPAVAAVLLAAVSSAEPVQWNSASGGNGHLYEFVSTPEGMTWHEASNDAIARGGHLATITSAEENDFVFSVIQNNNNAWATFDFNGNLVTFGPWLGAYQPDPDSSPGDGWLWITDEVFRFTAWSAFDPNDNNVQESFLSYGASGSEPAATWFDRVADFGDSDPTLFPDQVQVRGYILETIPSPAVIPVLALYALHGRLRKL